MNKQEKLVESLAKQLQEDTNVDLTNNDIIMYEHETRTLYIDAIECTIGTGNNILQVIYDLNEEIRDDMFEMAVLGDKEMETLHQYPDTLFILQGSLAGGFSLMMLDNPNTTLDSLK